MYPHPSYPVLVPLAETWVALNLGTWSDQLIKIIFPFATLSFLAIYNYFLASYTNKRWALLGVVMLLSSIFFINQSTIAYRDIFLSSYTCTAIMLLLIWLSKKDDAFLILASLYAGLATFIKVEGTPHLLICTALFFLVLFYQKRGSFGKNIIAFFKFTIPSFGICLVFYLYKILRGFPSIRIAHGGHIDLALENLKRIPLIIKMFSEDIFLSGNWNIIWFLLVLSLVVNFGKIRKRIEVKLLLIALIMFFGLYFSIALFTTEFMWVAGSKSPTTLSRLILHFFPLATLLIVLLNYPEGPRENMSSLKPLKQTQSR